MHVLFYRLNSIINYSMYPPFEHISKFNQFTLYNRSTKKPTTIKSFNYVLVDVPGTTYAEVLPLISIIIPILNNQSVHLPLTFSFNDYPELLI